MVETGATPTVVTFGCRLNASEARLIREQASLAGAEHLVIVNTCAVTGEAERQARQSVRRLRAENPDALLIVTGCSAQLAGDRWAEMPEVDAVLGNREKLDVRFYREALETKSSHVSDIAVLSGSVPPLIRARDGRARAFVHIQQGCDHSCTFCVVPMARGPATSLPYSRILEQTRLLVEDGVREIILCGVDLASYQGGDQGDFGLGHIARALLADVPDIARLRLSSLDPLAALQDKVLLRLIAEEPRVMEHIHLSVQSGSDPILKRMKRRHLRSDVIELTDTLRKERPEIAFGADMIAGFPTESADHFQQSVDLIDDAGLSHLHIFPYSPRPGTPAARMPLVPRAEVKDRARRLREKADGAFQSFLNARLGTLEKVLVEKPGFGYARAYFPVRVAETETSVGEIVTVRLREIEAGPVAVGEKVEDA